VTQVGIKPPPNPAHGPWRRVSAQANEADIRVVPEPGAIVSLASGLALLSPVPRGRLLKRRSPLNREAPGAHHLVAGARYARVCTLPMPLVLPVEGRASPRAALQ
jgi:hypothetical protein